MKNKTLALAALLTPSLAHARCVGGEGMGTLALLILGVLPWMTMGGLAAMMWLLKRAGSTRRRPAGGGWTRLEKVLASSAFGTIASLGCLAALDLPPRGYRFLVGGPYLFIGIPAMITWCLWATAQLLESLGD